MKSLESKQPYQIATSSPIYPVSEESNSDQLLNSPIEKEESKRDQLINPSMHEKIDI